MTPSESTSTSLSSNEMKLYQVKPLDFGFVVLCIGDNASLAKATIRNLEVNYPTAPSIVIVGETMHKDNVKMLNGIRPIYQGSKTITSLINAGMRHAPADWNMLIIAGSHVQSGLDRKFSLFVERETDILFPIADKKYIFTEGTINGICMHRNTFKMVGNMPENGSLDECKLEWSVTAIEKGCSFKAIAGAKIC